MLAMGNSEVEYDNCVGTVFIIDKDKAELLKQNGFFCSEYNSNGSIIYSFKKTKEVLEFIGSMFTANDYICSDLTFF